MRVGIKTGMKNRIRSLGSYVSLSAFLSALALGGCTWIGPQYHKPKNEHPKKFEAISEDNKDIRHSVSEQEMKDPWWENFHDPELTLLEARVAIQNLDVLNSIAELAQSRAMMMIAGAERFPNLAASGDYSRFQRSSAYIRRIVKDVGRHDEDMFNNLGSHGIDVSKAGITPGALRDALHDFSKSFTIPQLNNWQYGLDASYEVDLWGRVARQYEAAKALSAMSVEERRTILIAKQAEMAQNYISLRSNQKKLEVLNRLVALLKEKEELASSRYDKGLNSDQIIEAVKIQQNNIEAQIPSLKQEILVGINEISLMLGQEPHALEKELTQHIDMPKPPAVAPIGLPSNLAERRPDIRMAEQNLRRTLEEVGEAEAEFYPKFTINASFGIESLSIKDMGSWGARAWNIGPAVSLPIFQGGRLWGQLNLKKAAQKSAAISYHKTVLTAWQEVSNALSAYGKTQKRFASFSRKVAAAKRNANLVDSQHKTGLVNKMVLLDAQIDETQMRLDHIQSYGDISSSLAKLYNALGGGWKEFIPETSNGGSGESHAAFERDKATLRAATRKINKG